MDIRQTLELRALSHQSSARNPVEIRSLPRMGRAHPLPNPRPTSGLAARVLQGPRDGSREDSDGLQLPITPAARRHR